MERLMGAGGSAGVVKGIIEPVGCAFYLMATKL